MLWIFLIARHGTRCIRYYIVGIRIIPPCGFERLATWRRQQTRDFGSWIIIINTRHRNIRNTAALTIYIYKLHARVGLCNRVVITLRPRPLKVLRIKSYRPNGHYSVYDLGSCRNRKYRCRVTVNSHDVGLWHLRFRCPFAIIIVDMAQSDRVWL